MEVMSVLVGLEGQETQGGVGLVACDGSKSSDQLGPRSVSSDPGDGGWGRGRGHAAQGRPLGVGEGHYWWGLLKETGPLTKTHTSCRRREKKTALISIIKG